MSIVESPPDCGSPSSTRERNSGGNSLSSASLAVNRKFNLSRPPTSDRVAPNKPPNDRGAAVVWDNAGVATIKAQQATTNLHRRGRGDRRDSRFIKKNSACSALRRLSW